MVTKPGPAAKITLDDEPIGSEGEVEDKTIAMEHRIGTESPRTVEFQYSPGTIACPALDFLIALCYPRRASSLPHGAITML